MGDGPAHGSSGGGSGGERREKAPHCGPFWRTMRVFAAAARATDRPRRACDEWSSPMQVPYLTAQMPGIGGEIKRVLDDFVVQELPLYELAGVGTHCYFSVEK